MTLQEFSEKFVPLPAQEKIRFIYTNIDSLGQEDKTLFLLSILKEEYSSPLVKATALKFLRETSYQESGLYQNFIDDQFRAIANAAKAAVKELGEKKRDNDYYAGAVLRKLRSLPDKDRRLKILKAVARLKAPWVTKVLVEALDDPAQMNRDFLVSELAGAGKLGSVDPLRKADPAPVVCAERGPQDPRLEDRLRGTRGDPENPDRPQCRRAPERRRSAGTRSGARMRSGCWCGSPRTGTSM